MWPRSRASNRGVSTTLANSKIVAAPLRVQISGMYFLAKQRRNGEDAITK